jgi:thiol:disulfide interchange protein DsbD
MKLVQRLTLVLALGLLAASAQAANTTARLVLSHEAAKPGDTVWAGVHLRMAPKWHTYWENGGDSGAATKIEWTLPAGVSAGEILWPVPEKYDSAGLITYVYHHDVVLLVPLSIAANATPGSLELKAKVSWLECAELCFPANASVAAKLTVAGESKSSTNAAFLETWRTKLPQPKPASFARAWWEKDAEGDKRPLLIEWSATRAAKGFDFYPHASTNAAVQTATELVTRGPGTIRLRKSVEKLEGEWPAEIAGLLIEQGEGNGPPVAHHIRLAVESASATSAASPRAEADEIGGEKKPLLVWLAFAFIGGLILNLMPCVLPVIALKIFGFVNQARETPAQVRKLGIVYGLGVLFSFLILAGVVIGVQSAGRLASWGMQFGNPYFLVGMIALVTLVALNLFGLFEVSLGSGAMGAASELAAREGASGAFFNGVLATALATPCSAPFLAGALGFAFAQPPPIIVLMFLSVGAGLAAPYVALSFQPAWLKFLPKPGAWMGRFKIAMGFPMLATAVWLLSIAARHYGNGGVLWIGVFLIFVAIAAWIYGEFVQRGSRRKGLAVVLSLAFLGGGYVLALEQQLHWRNPPKLTTGAISQAADGIQWLPWSREAVAKARDEGRPVFVDFTADWCVTCQANKKTSIEIEPVRKKLKEIDAVALLGDYTLIDPLITEELKRFGRAAVPLVLVYPRDASKPPIELPALLTPGIVLDALDKAAR